MAYQKLDHPEILGFLVDQVRFCSSHGMCVVKRIFETKLFYPPMKDSVVLPMVGMKATSVYSASKGAIAQLTKSLALEAAEYGIRVNAVAPGVVETNILSGIMEDSRATLASYGHAHPLGRVALPEEIAEAIIWLTSPKASFVTGRF